MKISGAVDERGECAVSEIGGCEKNAKNLEKRYLYPLTALKARDQPMSSPI